MSPDGSTTLTHRRQLLIGRTEDLREIQSLGVIPPQLLRVIRVGDSLDAESLRAPPDNGLQKSLTSLLARSKVRQLPILCQADEMRCRDAP